MREGYYVVVWTDGAHEVLKYDDVQEAKKTEGYLVSIAVSSISNDIFYGGKHRWQLRPKIKETNTN